MPPFLVLIQWKQIPPNLYILEFQRSIFKQLIKKKETVLLWNAINSPSVFQGVPMCSSNWNLGSWRQNLSDWISSGRVGVPNVVAHSYPVTSQLPDSSAHGPGVPRRANCPVWSCDVKDVASYLHDSVSRIGTKWWSVSHLAASAAVTLTKYTVANGHVLREEKKKKRGIVKATFIWGMPAWGAMEYSID